MRTNHFYLIFQLLLAASLIFTNTSCTSIFKSAGQDSQAAAAPPPITDPELLCSDIINENESLKTDLAQLSEDVKSQEELITKLQLGLLEKHAEYNKLLVKNERLLNEFVRHKPQMQRSGNRVESVRLLAEVVATIETAKSLDTEKKWTKTINKAEKFLAESQIELDAGNIDGASYLASQAIELIQSTKLEEPGNKEKVHAEIPFQAHLPMKVLKNANVREKPTLHSSILHVQKAGSVITAVGYDELWVKIMIPDGKFGWIHYSLLSGSF